jgi:hypothetical protein
MSPVAIFDELSGMRSYHLIVGAALLGLTAGCGARLGAPIYSPPSAAEFFGPDRPEWVDDGLARYF